MESFGLPLEFAGATPATFLTASAYPSCEVSSSALPETTALVMGNSCSLPSSCLLYSSIGPAGSGRSPTVVPAGAGSSKAATPEICKRSSSLMASAFLISASWSKPATYGNVISTEPTILRRSSNNGISTSTL